MRRGEYLAAAGDLLVANLQEVTDEWAPGQDNYRKTFVGMDDETALSYMLQGIGFLAKGELAGERLSVAYDSQLQEDEHSCFSDNTHMDIRANMKSIANVYRGSYLQVNGSTVTGTSLSDLVAAKDATLAADIETLLDECTTACENIQAPFDQEILASNPAGRERVNEAITKLRQLGDKLSEAAGVLGVSITIE
jgi:putative iron-regulated protein